MRVLYVVSRLEWQGGIGRVVAGIARALAERGHEVHVAGSGASAPSAVPPGVTIHLWKRRRQKIQQTGALLALQRRLGADVVHFHSALPHGELVLALRAVRGLLGSPRLFVTPWTSLRVEYPKRRARIGLRAVDAVIAPSLWSAKRAIEAGATPDAVHVVQGGIDLPEEVPAHKREPAVLMLGRLVGVKGVDTLIEAFDRVAATRPDWCLWIGGAGRDEQTLRSRAAAADAADRILFLGQVSGAHKRELLERAAIGAMPSLAESMGGALLEFQAHGLACVASDVGGLRELSQQGAAARLVNPNDPAELAKGLAELMDDPKLRGSLGGAGRRAAWGYRWAAVAEQTEALYERYREAG